ncbi:MAG TPA: YciI family protein [Telluria sp.]
MQFMLIRIDHDPAAHAAADPAAVLDDLLRRLPPAGGAGAPALAVAFAPDHEALRLRLGPGFEAVSSGPFAPAERLPAGFAVFEAPSRAAALEMLRRAPADAAGDAAVTLELRETGCAGGCAGISPESLDGGSCYAILLRADAATERDAIPAQEKLDRLNAFNATEAASGTLLAGDGLKGSARGARLRSKKGQTSVIDGPFAEAKELIAGFWMVRAASREAALDWARGLPYPTGPEVEVEIRRVAALAGPPSRAPLAEADLRADASLRAEQLDAALRAQLAPRPAWDRP